MHELSLVQGLLHQLEGLVRENGADRILRVRVEIGPRSGIVVDSFKFGFEVLADQNALCREAELEIVTPEQQYRCGSCGGLTESSATAPLSSCSECGAAELFPEGGDQMILLQVEMI